MMAKIQQVQSPVYELTLSEPEAQYLLTLLGLQSGLDAERLSGEHSTASKADFSNALGSIYDALSGVVSG
jgi:hypothetical protein